MPTFDVVSEVDLQEVRNAVDQAAREVANRFDFKGTDSKVTLGDDAIDLESETEERLKALRQVVEEKLAKRKVSLRAVSYDDVEQAGGGRARQRARLNVGIDHEKAKAIGKYLKAHAPKGISHQVQGDRVRVQSKKRDHLQTAIQALKEEDFGIPLQYVNFRD